MQFKTNRTMIESMTIQLFALQLHNDDVTPVDDVISILQEFGFSKVDALEFTVETHGKITFFIEFGSREEMLSRKKQLEGLVERRGSTLRCSVDGPFDERVREVWLRKRRSARGAVPILLLWFTIPALAAAAIFWATGGK
jgi:ATP-dependent Clp protease adapter protein ClpS